jgi:uncharacterized protein (DUF433 family)
MPHTTLALWATVFPADTGSRTMNEDDLIARWIAEDPDRPGAANARIAAHGVHVWALIGHLRAVEGKPWVVADDYELPVEAVEAAVVYYARNQTPIEAKLMANAARPKKTSSAA